MKTREKSRYRSLRATQRKRLLFLVPVVADVLLVFIYPLINNIRMGFQHYSIASFVNGTAPFVGLKNYIDIFHSPLMGQTVVNTVIFTIGSIAFQFTIGLMFALFFKRRFALSRLMRTLLLVPWLLPLIVSATAFRWMFDHTNGIINQFMLNLHLISKPLPWLIMPHLALLSVIITNIWVGIPFNMVLLYGGLMNIPDEFYEAASIDGASGIQSFWYIPIPVLREVIMIVLMLGLIYTLKVFDIIRVLTGGGPANSTQILSTWSYSLSFTDLSFGQGAAVGNVLMLVTLVFAIIYLRVIRSSLTSS
jgi:multiple sugar transport system permease protein